MYPISRDKVLKMLDTIATEVEEGYGFQYEKWVDYAKHAPSVYSDFQIQKMLTRQEERKTGQWVEKKVLEQTELGIEEWQSTRCSVCGRYHTTPYMYHFYNYAYCPCCGAKMEEGELYENG